MNQEDKKRNHATIFSADGSRILAEQDGTKSSSVIYSPDGRVLSKRGLNEDGS
jgi:hypothetical protein